MKKKFRKIVVDDIEYDWFFNYDKYGYHSVIFIYEVYYEYNVVKNIDVRRRKELSEFVIDEIYDFDNEDYCNIRPCKVRQLIKYGRFLDEKQHIRKLKLKKINDRFKHSSRRNKRNNN